MYPIQSLSDMKESKAIETKKTQYQACLKTASLAFLDERNYKKALSAYTKAMTLINNEPVGEIKVYLLKYMICCCLVQSNNIEDLAEAIRILQKINKNFKDRFPAIYCLLAQAHCKLYRFHEALKSFNQANDIILNRSILLEVFYVPGTSVPIHENQIRDVWLSVKKKSEYWQKPDAVCASKDCNHITQPYVTVNINIYKRDPAFNGMVVIHCDNKNYPCTLKFHPSCWKVIKDAKNLVENVSDKNMLGFECLTPNCMNDNVRCTISMIVKIGKTGQEIAQIKQTPTDSWLINKNISKGAVNKQKAAYVKVSEASHFTHQKPKVSAVPTNDCDLKKKNNNHDGYDENQLLTAADIILSNSLLDDSPKAGEITFIISFFHHYIKENLVRICDLYKKFSEIRDDLKYLKDIDILTFLLEANVVAMNDNSEFSKEKDVCDMLDNFINDDDLIISNDANGEIENNYFLDEQNSLSTCNAMYKEMEVVVGGDTPTSNSLQIFIDDVSKIKEVTENKNSKDVITSLKSEIECLTAENSRFKKELQDKDKKIETFLQQMNQFEALYAKMMDFKQRYDKIKNDNFNLKEEMLSLINDKKTLTNEIEKLNNSDEKRKELKTMFQAEYTILEKCINDSWKKKTEELQASLEQESETKKSLSSKYVCAVFDANKSILNGHIEQCQTALEVIYNLNGWMNKYLNIKTFRNDTDWKDRLKHLEEVTNKFEVDYKAILEKIDSDEECPTEIFSNCLIVPKAPMESLSNVVMNGLNYYHRTQYEYVRKIMQIHQHENQRLQQQWQTQHQQSSLYMNNYPFATYQHVMPFTGAIDQYPQVPQITALTNIVPATQRLPYKQPLVASNSENSDPIHNKSSIEIQELSKSNENTSIVKENIDNETIKDCDDLVKKDLNEKQKKNEELNEEQKNSEESIENIDEYFDKLAKRRVELRKALNSIALNVKEKAEVKNTKPCVNGNINVKNNEQVKSESNDLHLGICDDQSDGTTATTTNELLNFFKEDNCNQQSKRTAGINSLIKIMQTKHPEALQSEIVNIIFEIRKKNNNSLTGKSVAEILNESEEHFLCIRRTPIASDDEVETT